MDRALAPVSRVSSGALALAALLALLLAGDAAALGTHRYDRDIRDAARTWLPQWDWLWWRAQLYQESRLDPAAVSPVGAAGLAQIMPATAREVARQMGLGVVSAFDVGPAVEMGAFYMHRMRRTWSSPRPERDRRELAEASYNAGAGNLIRAQRACGGALRYPAIAACLPQITGEHSRETLGYVRRIRRWYLTMVAER